MNGHLHWYPVSQRVDLSFRSHEVQFILGPESGDGWRRDSDDRSHHEKRARAPGAETLFSGRGPLAKAVWRPNGVRACRGCGEKDGREIAAKPLPAVLSTTTNPRRRAGAESLRGVLRPCGTDFRPPCHTRIVIDPAAVKTRRRRVAGNGKKIRQSLDGAGAGGCAARKRF